MVWNLLVLKVYVTCQPCKFPKTAFIAWKLCKWRKGKIRIVLSYAIATRNCYFVKREFHQCQGILFLLSLATDWMIDYSRDWLHNWVPCSQLASSFFVPASSETPLTHRSTHPFKVCSSWLLHSQSCCNHCYHWWQHIFIIPKTHVL